MERIADQIIDELNKQDLEEILGSSNYEDDDDDDTMGYPSDDDDDDDVDLSFLSDLGIDTPPTK
jgi:hypothetical protein